MNTGEIHWDSRYSPTSLSIKRAVERGAEQSTFFSLQRLSKKTLDSSVCNSVFLGILIPSASSRPFIIGILRYGGVKSIS